jgi:pSer/pThr/pTyr-binding forkhead associated (FHA) protein
MASWLIGGDRSNDVIVDLPTVSARHCCLAKLADGQYHLQDLGSKNGTYVNGRRIELRALVTAEDIVTLGEKTPMPWPRIPANLPQRTISIGSADDNDLVIDKATISLHHAQLAIFQNHLEVEDLGSANGTFLRNHDSPIKWAVMTLEDTLFLGSYQVPRERLWQAVATTGVQAEEEPLSSPAPVDQASPASLPQSVIPSPPFAPPIVADNPQGDTQNTGWPAVPQSLEMSAEDRGRASSPKRLHPLINALGFIIFSLGGMGLGYLIVRWLGIW